MTNPNSKTVHLANLGVGLDELVEAMVWGLREIGYTVTTEWATTRQDCINILFAAFALKYEEVMANSPRLINYNLEQIGGETRPAIGAQSFSLMRNLPNWDYSRQNIRALNATGICDITHVPIGYAPTLERIKHADKDIDVLFYGSMNGRRKAVIDAIEQKGLKVVWSTGEEWDRETRDAHIARAKVVLNMAFYGEIHIFEEIRVSYLLANRVCVVSEVREDTFIEDDMRRCVAGGTLVELPDLCVAYCADANKRTALAELAHRIFKQRPWLPALKDSLESYIANNPEVSRARKHDVTPPTKINIGSGRFWRFDRINIDIDSTRGADLLFDLNQPFPYESWIPAWRFGKIKIPKNSIDHILAEHVLEHVRDLIQCMTTCMEWLKVGGTLEIEVPYDLSYGAWQDPTHVRAFNERSWNYYADWCWYVGWREYRFDVTSQVHLLSDIGNSLTAAGMDDNSIIRTPRAVDALRVKLVKRALTDAEKEDHQQYFRTV